MKNILITGQSGVGKTSLIVKIGEIFKEFNPSGFYTADIIENGDRSGFEIISMSGESHILAHTSFKSGHSVGKFKVDVRGFDKFIENTFSREKKRGFYIIDEIGKMECKSRKFSVLIRELLGSDKPVLATVPDKGTGLIQEVKKRDDVTLIELSPENASLILKDLTMTMRDLLLE